MKQNQTLPFDLEGFAREVALVRVLGEKIGFGNLMSIASSLWRLKLVESGAPGEGARVAANVFELRSGLRKAALRDQERFDPIVRSALDLFTQEHGAAAPGAQGEGLFPGAQDETIEDVLRSFHETVSAAVWEAAIAASTLGLGLHFDPPGDRPEVGGILAFAKLRPFVLYDAGDQSWETREAMTQEDADRRNEALRDQEDPRRWVPDRGEDQGDPEEGC
jgi:hypothetical protein